MKKLLYSVLAGSVLFCGKAEASPGDTTWAQSHTDVQLTSFGDFDAPISFPTGSLTYRKIYMIFELGKYQCPGNPQYCYDWDYTVSTQLMNSNGDTIELGRLITPYADHSLGARMPLTWKGKYVFDVTDYTPLLKNNAHIRVGFSGYSYGFTATVKFAFIEGTPERTVIGLKKLWLNNYNYGHGSIPINTALGNVSLTAPAGTVSAESKITITGHGGDATANAAEFYPNSYTLNLNNNPITTKNFWRDNCGFNNYYPQNGTWVYNRASWCPGDLVHVYSHSLTGITANSNYTISATFPPYTSNPNSSGSQAAYTIQNTVVYYGALNNSLDASIEDIIAPTNEEKHFRANPFVGKPQIEVRNSGGTAITSIKFEYGVDGTALQQFTWNGNLPSLTNTTIALAECATLKTVTAASKFVVKILQVNGQADNDATNDTMNSYFTPAPVWPQSLRLEMKTNGSVGTGGLSENNWKLFDAAYDTIVAQRINNTITTTYVDTVYLNPGYAYKLVIEDEGCDGMNWWVFPYYNPNPGVGYMRVRSLSSIINLPMNGYFNGDFGCGFTQYFTTSGTVSVPEIDVNTALNIAPNPTRDHFTLTIEGFSDAKGTLYLTDATGRLLYKKEILSANTTVNTKQFANGTYILKYQNNKTKAQLQSKIVILD
ncbi:MAG TPA: peptide-N-glycosidase F-related protein [Flavipsychrobacter sp.]|nr:peptide-N-glycosidase F-related protein [Flavipsychrobacter sp.]